MLTTSAPAVSIDNLRYRYCSSDPDSQVLDSVSLDVYPGELVILTGASGSGKTTLLTLIGGLRSGGSGQLNVLGVNLISATPSDILHLRKCVGFIFQSHNLLPYLTASENIRVGLEIHEYWRHQGLSSMQERCHELLHLLELGSKAHFKPRNLSLGQKQRISIARAISNNPHLILADEPTASLDKDSAKIVVTLLKDLTNTMGTAVIVVTHDTKILDYADRIIRLDNGRVI